MSRDDLPARPPHPPAATTHSATCATTATAAGRTSTDQVRSQDGLRRRAALQGCCCCPVLPARARVQRPNPATQHTHQPPHVHPCIPSWQARASTTATLTDCIPTNRLCASFLSQTRASTTATSFAPSTSTTSRPSGAPGAHARRAQRALGALPLLLGPAELGRQACCCAAGLSPPHWSRQVCDGRPAALQPALPSHLPP